MRWAAPFAPAVDTVASQKEIEASYNYLDGIVRATLGPTPDFSCAFYDGDYSKTLEQAQRDKHEYILRNLNFREGFRLLDIGCGWGPVLNAVRERGGHGVGVTLSTSQVENCRRLGLDAHLMDWRDMTAETFGRFDGVASLGAFEHFCSIGEYLAGKQEQVYRVLFRLCHDLLPGGGRLFLQTMMWGSNAPPYDAISLSAPRDSSGYMVAVLSRFYPGSWLPFGEKQIISCAEPCFRAISLNNGRKDYLETMKQWRLKEKINLSRLSAMVKMVPYAWKDPDFFRKMESLFRGYQRKLFEREVIDHQRIVFEKIQQV